MTVRHVFALSAALAMTFAVGAASALNPCEESGPGCRVMTAAETKAYRNRLEAFQAALPVPDPYRYRPSSLDDFVGSMTKTAKSAGMGAVEGPRICISWPGGCFPTELRDINRSYSLKQERLKTDRSANDLASLAQGMANEMAGAVQVGANFNPFPYLVPEEKGKCLDVPSPDAVAVEKTPTFLAYEQGDEESVTLTLVFGKRTCREADTLNVDKPAKNFAPVVSVELIVSAPKAELAALKKKINRKAFEALLGPVVK